MANKVPDTTIGPAMPRAGATENQTTPRSMREYQTGPVDPDAGPVKNATDALVASRYEVTGQGMKGDIIKMIREDR